MERVGERGREREIERETTIERGRERVGGASEQKQTVCNDRSNTCARDIVTWRARGADTTYS